MYLFLTREMNFTIKCTLQQRLSSDLLGSAREANVISRGEITSETNTPTLSQCFYFSQRFVLFMFPGKLFLCRKVFNVGKESTHVCCKNRQRRNANVVAIVHSGSNRLG